MSEERHFLGLYVGGALDGIDASVIAVRGEGPGMSVQQLGGLTQPLDDGVRHRLLLASGIGRSPGGEAGGWPRLAAELDRDLAVAAGDAGRTLLGKLEIPPDRLAATGLDGAEVLLRPPEHGHDGAIVRLGDPAVLADRLGCAVVADFAAGDLAAGGVGGPVCAWCDWLWLRHERLSRVAVHLGAVASFTFVPAQAQPCDLIAADVGPGTAVLDELTRRHHHQPFDTDGAIAAGGQVSGPLLNELASAPYFQQPMPRRCLAGLWRGDSLWRLEQMAESHRCGGADLLATVAELSARAIRDAIASLTERPHEVILSGGGAMNIHLAGRIRQLLSPTSTYTSQRYGLELRTKQAACRAVLAAARLAGHPAHSPAATGARRTRILGSITML